VRKAIDELCAANILVRQQGRGTFVTTHDRDRNLFYFFHVVPGPRAGPGDPLTNTLEVVSDRGHNGSGTAAPSGGRPRACPPRPSRG